MMVDADTRLDTTLGGPGAKYTYLYALVNYSSASVDATDIQQKTKPFGEEQCVHEQTNGHIFEKQCDGYLLLRWE